MEPFIKSLVFAFMPLFEIGGEQIEPKLYAGTSTEGQHCSGRLFQILVSSSLLLPSGFSRKVKPVSPWPNFRWTRGGKSSNLITVPTTKMRTPPRMLASIDRVLHPSKNKKVNPATKVVNIIR
jgi:hypothetical protein